MSSCTYIYIYVGIICQDAPALIKVGDHDLVLEQQPVEQSVLNKFCRFHFSLSSWRSPVWWCINVHVGVVGSIIICNLQFIQLHPHIQAHPLKDLHIFCHPCLQTAFYIMETAWRLVQVMQWNCWCAHLYRMLWFRRLQSLNDMCVPWGHPLVAKW